MVWLRRYIFFFENAKNLGRWDDGKRREKKTPSSCKLNELCSKNYTKIYNYYFISEFLITPELARANSRKHYTNTMSQQMFYY